MTSTAVNDRDAAATLRMQAHQVLARGEWLEARALFLQAIAAAPDAPILRLELGQVLERLGQQDAATRSYYLAVMKARARGLWLDDSSVPPAIYPQVLHAMRFVEQHRDAVLQRLLEPWLEKFGARAIARVVQALEIYLARDMTRPAHPAQKPLFFYVPGLREQPFFDASEFACSAQALAAQAEIAREAQQAIAYRTEPFLEGDPAHIGQMLATTQADAAQAAGWNAYFFYRHGQAFADNLARCPKTAEFLASFPRVDIQDHAPEVCFSVLAPQSHILPHTGVTNSRLVMHLPLHLPRDCALKVAGIERAWQMHEVLVFDDTFEHEAWNRSKEARTILLMDIWHPDLTPAERETITAVVEGIGHFNRGH
jgi:aspartate beta-hydroxylase